MRVKNICLAALIVLLSGPFFCNSYGQNTREVLSMTEGEFAVKLIKYLKWENYLPVAADVEDHIRVLERFAVAPLEGWDKNRQLSDENRFEILAFMVGSQKLLYEKADKACKYNVDLINHAQQLDGGKRNIEEVARDKKYFPKKFPTCPWGRPYHSVDAKAVHHHHLAPILSIQEKEKGYPARKETNKDSKFRANLSVILDQVYDSNIFFAYGKKDQDNKIVLKPIVDISYTDKDIFGNIINYSEFAQYLEESVATFKNELMSRLSYYPSDSGSWGIRNLFTAAKKTQFTSDNVDRILALGYYTNVTDMGFKFATSKNLTTSFGYSLEFVDFTSSVYKIGPNKRTSLFSIKESYRMNPKVFPYANHYFKLIDFDYIKNKSGWLNGFGLGADFKLPRVANVNVEGAFEIKDHTDTNLFATEPKRHGFKYGARADSTFSRYTQVYLEYLHRPFTEASGINYRQFSSHYIGSRISQKLPHQMTLLLGGTVEFQYFKENDSFLTVLDDRIIVSSNYNAELRKNLTANTWLNLKYEYLRRDSDFTQDSYTDNLVTIGIGSRF